MVDVRDLYAIEEETVFHRTAATYQQVVPVAVPDSRRHAGKRTDYFRYIPVRPRTFFDFLHSDYPHGDRAFGRVPEPVAGNANLFQSRFRLGQFDVLQQVVGGDFKFGSGISLVA